MSEIGSRAEITVDIIETFANYAEGIDSKNWPLARSCFADEVYIDYGPGINGDGSPDKPRTAENWLEQVKSVINGFDTTRHTMTNHRIAFNGDEVECRAYLIADHVIFADPTDTLAAPEEIVTVVGEYTNVYRFIDGAWKICKSKLVIDYSTGNLALFETAAQRAAEMAST